MSIGKKLPAFAAGIAMLAVSLSGAAAEARTRAHHHHFAQRQVGCPVRRVAGGDLADCHGWRLRDGTWDNTCFNLDYLLSQYACSPQGGW